MDIERESTGATPHPHDAREHACPLLSEAALGDWTGDEEDAAWAHLQEEGLSGAGMARFAGTIPREDLDQVERIIEEECERIDHGMLTCA